MILYAIIGVSTVGIVGGLVLVAKAIRELIQVITELQSEVKNLRLHSRARVTSIETPSGTTKELKELRRLGRSSRAQRVVVGGDNDSPLNEQLNRGMTGGKS